ncbi:MAG: OmpA family protein [Magnetococcales bacterium]|nr:OmpA family protein [Magnetococcales bacterium]
MMKKLLTIVGVGALLSVAVLATSHAADNTFKPASWLQPSREHPSNYQPRYTGFGYHDGMEKDSDGDGVPDSRDKCPNTPKGVKVNSDGCPLDSDGDGVTDDLDMCPDTPKGTKVDARGCPITTRSVPVADGDSDGDGVVDSRDQCPGTPKGAVVDDRGCWTLKNLHFDTNKAVIKSGSYGVLDQVANILKQNPKLDVEVQGHTDNRASRALNKKLSEKRSAAVVSYLTKKGVAASRLKSAGYGFDRPVADNKTADGRARNRRVELHLPNVK